MADRLLLRGGYVLSMDPGLGEVPGGDVLIEGQSIVEVAQRIDVDDAENLARAWSIEAGEAGQ